MIKTTLTQEGLEKLKERKKLLENEYKRVTAGKAEAAEVGGNVWHDNPAFEEIEQKQRMLIGQIAEVQKMVDDSVAFQVSSKDHVDIGARVAVKFNENLSKDIIIGDSATSDLENNVVSCDSPIGKALLGGTVGEVREYMVGERKMAVTIEKISY